MRLTRGILLRLFLISACAAAVRGDTVRTTPVAQAAFSQAMPATVVWAWEEPEDLSSLDPQRVGVAYLAESLYLSDTVTVRPRRQPLIVPPGAAMMAVVRFEVARFEVARLETDRLPLARSLGSAHHSFVDSPELRRAAANALAEVARRPGTRALQIDFDATRSQRAFYAAVLEQLRPQLPPGMALSITALVSWCGAGNAGWLEALPVDEAVPMYFRLGVPHAVALDKNAYAIREPICSGSVGLSTDESWPAIPDHRRLYLFAPHPWSQAQLKAIATTKTSMLAQELSQ